MNRCDRRMLIVFRQAAAGGLGTGLMYGAGLRADHQRLDTGKGGTIRRAFFGPAAAALRVVAALAAPVAVRVLLISGCALCVALMVFHEDHNPGGPAAEGSDRE